MVICRNKASSWLLILSIIVTISKCDIFHQSQSKSLKVFKDNYSQFRAVGQGQRDASLNQGLTTVGISFEVQSVKPDVNSTAQPFDLFILTTTKDYECYIQAVTMLDQQIGLDCAFLNNSEQSHFNVTSYSETIDKFMDLNTEYGEYFFIIDNTQFPLFNFGSATSNISTTTKDIVVNVSITTNYLVTAEYFQLVYIVAGVGGALFVLLIISIICYKKNKKIYASLAEEKRKIREIQIKQNQGEYLSTGLDDTVLVGTDEMDSLKSRKSSIRSDSKKSMAFE